ncbi:MAG TPA: hypothetical protein VFX12_01310 [Vicinamibacterales bacterium]|nr:hypothetical protein [Vicinamibacterales bacterium]
MTTLQDFWRAAVRLLDAGGASYCPAPAVHQQEVIDAIDAVDPSTGVRRYRALWLDWSKKVSKDFMIGVALLYHLVADPFEREDRLAGVAAWDLSQALNTRRTMRQLIDRDPFLRAQVRELATSFVYTEQVRNTTGGTYRREHVCEFLTRDARGETGKPWSFVVRNELWVETDQAFSEALIVAPNRVAPLTLYASYAGLASQQRPGVPLYDLAQRAAAGDSTLFHTFVGGTGDRAPWRLCPWISEAWVDEQRRVFAAAPGRFKRTILNEPAGADGDALITHEEIRASLDATIPAEPLSGPLDGGLDLGLTNDHAVAVFGHTDGDARFVVDVVLVWKGTHDAPISYVAIEDAILALHRRVGIRSLRVDQWNATLLCEDLRRGGVPAKTVAVGQSQLDKIISTLKTTFSRRLIRIAPRETYLLEQLESLRVLEVRNPKRDLLKFQASGTGLDASAHDDGAVALGLVLADLGAALGRVTMAVMDECAREAHGVDAECILFNAETGRLYGDPLCKQCPGLQSAKAAHASYSARPGVQPLSLRSFLASGQIAPNAFITNRRLRAWSMDWL